MNFPEASALARTLLHSLWEGAIAALALAVVLSFVRSPRVRYAAACVAMLALLCGPAFTYLRLASAPAPYIPPPGPRFVAPLPPGLAATPFSPARTQASDELSWLVPFWIAGVAIFYLRGILSWIAARRLRRTGVCRASEEWQHTLARLQTKLRVSRPVALLESCLAEVPVVIGYLRPIILMPVGLLAGLPEAQLEAILLHELAHIRRYDFVVNLLQVFVEGLLFYHPAVWWISGVIRAERENCCDDLVIAVTGGTLEYAAALTALEINRAPREALAATGGSLVNRIERLLGRRERRYVAAIPIFVAALFTFVTAVAAWQSPPPAVSPHVNPSVPLMKLSPKTDTPGKTVLLAQAAQTRTSQPATQPDKTLFDQATRDIGQQQYSAARAVLNQLINTYPNSTYLPKAKLAIADSWAREGDAHGKAQAQAEYQDFIQFYPNAPETIEAKKALEVLLKSELSTPYGKWLNEDVVYIISNEERKAFHQLNTDEERNQFVEQFWLRRDPTPGTEENEFKREMYRRIAYANEHFAAGIPGWKTDRGRIYIQYGPPDEIENHPRALSELRPADPQDHAAPALRYEQWLYRYIEGVGRNVILEFVDKDRNGEYKLTMDPSSKDALPLPWPAAPSH